MLIRNAKAEWQGDLLNGSGQLSVGLTFPPSSGVSEAMPTCWRGFYAPNVLSLIKPYLSCLPPPPLLCSSHRVP